MAIPARSSCLYFEQLTPYPMESLSRTLPYGVSTVVILRSRTSLLQPAFSNAACKPGDLSVRFKGGKGQGGKGANIGFSFVRPLCCTKFVYRLFVNCVGLTPLSDPESVRA